MKVDILDYLGKHENGVIVLITIEHEEVYYQATFYYEKDLIALTPEESLEEKIGTQIEDWEHYIELIYLILSKVVPYDEVINITSNFDPKIYGLFLDKE